MKKNLYIFGLIFILVLSLGFLGYSLFRAKDPIIVDGSSQVATYLEKTRIEVETGTVMVQHANGQSEKVVQKLELGEKDIVLSEEGTKATIYWPDGSLSRVKGASKIEITKVAVGTNNLDVHVDATIHKGEVWTKVLNMLTENSEVQLRTQSTVAGIRGTIVYHNVTDTYEEVIPFEHAIVVETATDVLPLIENEGVKITSGQVEQFEITDPSTLPVVQENIKFDSDYMKQLGEKRRKLFAKDKEKIQLTMAEEQFSKYVEKTTLPTDMRKVLLETTMDRLMSEIADARAANDETKVIELLGKFDDRVKKASELYGSEGAKIMKDRMSFYAKVLFPEDPQSLDVLVRQNLVEKKVGFMQKEKDKEGLQVIAEKELFFAHDLAKKGKVDQAKSVLNTMIMHKEISQPVFEKHEDEQIQKKIEKRMGALDTTFVTPIEDFHKKLYDIKKDDFSALEIGIEQQQVKEVVVGFMDMDKGQRKRALENLPGLKPVLMEANDPRLQPYFQMRSPDAQKLPVENEVLPTEPVRSPSTTLQPKTTTTILQPKTTTSTTTLQPKTTTTTLQPKTTTTTTTLQPKTTTTTTTTTLQPKTTTTTTPTYRPVLTPPK